MTLFITKQISSDLIAYYVMSVQTNEYEKKKTTCYSYNILTVAVIRDTCV